MDLPKTQDMSGQDGDKYLHSERSPVQSDSHVDQSHDAFGVPLLKTQDSGYETNGKRHSETHFTNPAFEADYSERGPTHSDHDVVTSAENGDSKDMDVDVKRSADFDKFYDKSSFEDGFSAKRDSEVTELHQEMPSHTENQTDQLGLDSPLGEKVDLGDSTPAENLELDYVVDEKFGLDSESAVKPPPRKHRKVLKETELQNVSADPQNSIPDSQEIHFQLTSQQLVQGVSFIIPPPERKQGSVENGGAGIGFGSVEEGMQTDPPTVEAPEDLEPSLSPVRQLLSLWYVAVIVLTPLVLLPIPLIIGTQEAKCAYVIFVMAVFWVTEAIPIPVTSLMPIFFLPMMGLLTARQTSASYINDTSILFLGGLTVAIAIERWNLHRRIALSVMLIVGAEPRWLMLGMMSVTWFLSMWISNTATTAMMLPIVSAVLEQIGDTQRKEETEENPVTDSNETENAQKRSLRDRILRRHKRDIQPRTKDRKSTKQISSEKLEKALSLAIAYSANVGGIGSLTGTGPNLVLLGQSQIIFEEYGLNTPITFASWMVYGLPLSFLLVIVVWVWLQIVFLRCSGGCDCIFKRRSKTDKERQAGKVKAIIRAELKKLGPVTYAEGTIMFFFALLVLLWITRDLGGVGGWGTLFEDGFVSDSTPAILTAVLMFVLPSSLPDIFFPSRRRADVPHKPLKALMDWKTLHTKMPWSLYLLLGGGFAIARAAQDSGLSLWLGRALAIFGSLDPWLVLLIICYIVTFATEVTSNTAIATLMMPILAQLSLTLGLNPLFFMFPTAITTSFAFMLPVATPPNAIVFAFGAVRVVDMAMCGFILNLLSVPFLLLATITWGNAYFRFDVLPPEFSVNDTISLPPNSTLIQV